MYCRYGKRLLDIFLSGIALLLLFPVMLLVALAILVEDGTPVLFRQQRVGHEGVPFTVLKFRSMPVNTRDAPSAQAKSVRITRVGVIIRRTNIDELPQLFNIIRGDMSIVGPRPALASQQELCELRERQGALRCKPGLTGLAQVNSYDGMPDTVKAAWDAQYCAHVTFLNDVRIILHTFLYLLKPPPV
ncbi:MAG TPA: sugar transferase, partial [Anaerolineae bacterium]|nr:sugar transferase [Anaerolineae bacterium]